ncbi:DinB superfamily protein [Pseudobythopirellula maris]|uniref:DinB superfamily protein n=1 Tax=Pseudobythopirellula maris TaxID=2527991 RepID=A0A5C5ZHP4_9BACT|nr:DinB family protein [Pseudobythopirellula maris]TWT86882.1 DinB superfamily protein [Pseudobythopirellula maris]
MPDFRTNTRYALQRTRQITEALIEVLDGDDWSHRVAPDTNSPLWIIGHLAWVDNRMAGRFRPERALDAEKVWGELFQFGTKPLDAGEYPPIDEVLAVWRERRENLLAVFDEVSDEELDAPGPPADAASPIPGAPCAGYFFLFTSQHELLHTGQLTVVRRVLGHAPLR